MPRGGKREGAGRKTVSPKNKNIGLRLTDEEFQKIKSNVDELNISASDYIRVLIRSEKMTNDEKLYNYLVTKAKEYGPPVSKDAIDFFCNNEIKIHFGFKDDYDEMKFAETDGGLNKIGAFSVLCEKAYRECWKSYNRRLIKKNN